MIDPNVAKLASKIELLLMDVDGVLTDGKFLLIPISDKTRGHGTHTVAAVWKEPFSAFLSSLPPLPLLH